MKGLTGWGARVLLPLLAAAGLAISASAPNLDTAWLLPGGGVKLNRQAIRSGQKFCALTFDDGPDAAYTMKVADILARSGVPATFFVVGCHVRQYPEQVVALSKAGFEIGNHSWSHPDFTKLGAERRRSEIDRTNAELAKLGVHPRWFRPPYGAFNRNTVSICRDCGLTPMLWSVDPRDWSEPGAGKIVSRVVGATGSGSVILLHSTHGQTVQALPDIIAQLRERGYRFVTLSEWALLAAGETLPASGPPSLRDVAPSAPGALPAIPSPPGIMPGMLAEVPESVDISAQPRIEAPMTPDAHMETAEPAAANEMVPELYIPFGDSATPDSAPAPDDSVEPVANEPEPDGERSLRWHADSTAAGVRQTYRHWLALGGDMPAAETIPPLEMPAGEPLDVFSNFGSPAEAETILGKR